jgi:hypothetical protein
MAGVSIDDIPPDAIVAGAPLPLQAIAEELRRVVKAALPDAVERVRPGWGLIGYDVPNGKRTAYVAWIWPEREHCHLGFQQGWAMRDPHGVLQGAGITKQVRWLTFDAGDAIDHDLCRELLLEAVEVGRMTRGERAVRAEAATIDQTVHDLDRPPADWPGDR